LDVTAVRPFRQCILGPRRIVRDSMVGVKSAHCLCSFLIWLIALTQDLVAGRWFLRENAHMPHGSAETFNQFVTAINDHDVKALAALMSAEHVFVDSLGNRVQDAARMQAGWGGYFTMCPDYWIRIDTLLSEG